MPSRGTFRKTVSAMVAAVFVLTQISTFAHSALTAHRICQRHGELVHQGPSASGAAPSAKGWAGEPDEATDVAGHVHGCVFVGSARSLAGPVPPGGALSGLETAAVQRIMAARPAPRSIAPILLAPKHSPPVAL